MSCVKALAFNVKVLECSFIKMQMLLQIKKLKHIICEKITHFKVLLEILQMFAMAYGSNVDYGRHGQHHQPNGAND